MLFICERKDYLCLKDNDWYLGETPLTFINPHLWRAKSGAVMQDGFIFSDTIANNIAIDTEHIDVERLRHAVTVANIRDFIDLLPLGYNTKIGMEGNGISQGQKQRLLIAWAVYKNPEFLFFDEATNALDANNEKEIMEQLHAFYRGKQASADGSHRRYGLHCDEGKEFVAAVTFLIIER